MKYQKSQEKNTRLKIEWEPSRIHWIKTCFQDPNLALGPFEPLHRALPKLGLDTQSEMMHSSSSWRRLLPAFCGFKIGTLQTVCGPCFLVLFAVHLQHCLGNIARFKAILAWMQSLAGVDFQSMTCCSCGSLPNSVGAKVFQSCVLTAAVSYDNFCTTVER